MEIEASLSNKYHNVHAAKEAALATIELEAGMKL
jgi:hypothetical protein